MSKYHSMVSRRDFMKGLGLVGAGLGAAAALSPAFRDLDEMVSASPKVHNWPWWVKELNYDTTTTEIDWGLANRFDARHMTQCGWQGPAEMNAWIDLRDGAGSAKKYSDEAVQRKKDGLAAKDPWYGIRNLAMSSAMGYGMFEDSPNGFLGPKATTPEQRGTTKWTGTPEEASIMMRQVMVLLGASDVSFVELNPATTRNLVVRNDYHDGKPYIFEDVDQPYATGPEDAGARSKGPLEGKRVIPQKARYLMQFSYDESAEIIGRNMSGGGLRYSMGRRAQLMIQSYLKSIGYLAIGPLDYTNNLTQNVGLAILGGGSELGRNNLSISPTFGAVQGQASSIITDMPMAPTKPIDAGIHRFCYDCMKCAINCPGGALSRQGDPNGEIIKEPTWEGYAPSHRWEGRTAYEAKTPNVYRQELGTSTQPFFRHWWYDFGDCNPKAYDLCGSWGCGVVCTFKDGANAGIHQIVKATVATTPVLNTFFRAMDDTFYGDPAYFRRKEADAVDAFYRGELHIPRHSTDSTLS